LLGKRPRGISLVESDIFGESNELSNLEPLNKKVAKIASSTPQEDASRSYISFSNEACFGVAGSPSPQKQTDMVPKFSFDIGPRSLALSSAKKSRSVFV
jgi:hypothetical protein